MSTKRSVGPDLGLAIALSWLMVAIIASVTLGPRLGGRGWLWLGAHNVLCLSGLIHEGFKAVRRYRAGAHSRAKG